MGESRQPATEEQRANRAQLADRLRHLLDSYGVSRDEPCAPATAA
jgi:hypothetical protein